MPYIHKYITILHTYILLKSFLQIIFIYLLIITLLLLLFSTTGLYDEYIAFEMKASEEIASIEKKYQYKLNIENTRLDNLKNGNFNLYVISYLIFVT